MDWFLYDNGLRHERVKRYFFPEVKMSFAYSRVIKPIRQKNVSEKVINKKT